MSKTITLAHGSGGRASQDLIQSLFCKTYNNEELWKQEDSALLPATGQPIVFSTDSFVVDPIFFPGGDIGKLAVHGTINDLAMRGAKPLYLSVGMILEEGLPLADLDIIVRSIQEAADAADVTIVTGDTKVVPKGKADKIFINTSGIGFLERNIDISGQNGKTGDKVILSGTMADHGATILCSREGLQMGGDMQSDTAGLQNLVSAMVESGGESLHVLRDPTRGGVATTLNELAQSSKIGIRIFEDSLPVLDSVRGACELLGLDPLYLANEGKLLAFVSADKCDALLAAMRCVPEGKNACVIGELTTEHTGQVVLETRVGGRRAIDMLHGEPLPRIC